MFKYQADSLPGWFCNTCDPIINPPHSSRTSTSNTHPLDSPSFDALIQSLRSHNHPIPKGARPSFASGLSKLINRAIFKRTTGLAASTMLPPLRPVIRSRTLPDQLHKVKNQHIPGIRQPPEACSLSQTRNPTQPNNTHRDPATNMKSLVNQNCPTSISKVPCKYCQVIALLLTPAKNPLIPFNKNTPRPHLSLCYPLPQALPLHQHISVKTKYRLQSLPSPIAPGQDQKD